MKAGYHQRAYSMEQKKVAVAGGGVYTAAAKPANGSYMPHNVL